MNRFNGRLEKLEAAAEPPLTDAERLRRLNYLLTYEGDDVDMRYRQARLRELLALARARKAAEER